MGKWPPPGLIPGLRRGWLTFSPSEIFVRNRTPLKRKQVLRFGIRLNLNMRHPMLKKKDPMISVHAHHRTILFARAE
jgi:hypothetical protein